LYPKKPHIDIKQSDQGAMISIALAEHEQMLEDINDYRIQTSNAC
jgi:hypothetical protein